MSWGGTVDSTRGKCSGWSRTHLLILVNTLAKTRSKAMVMGGQRSIIIPDLGVAPALPQGHLEEATARIPRVTAATGHVPWLHWPVSTMYGELNPNNRQYTLYWFPVLSKVTNHNPTELFVTHGYAKYKHFHQYLIRQSFNLCVHIPRRPRHMNVTENLWASEGKLGCQSSPCTLLETGSLAVHPAQNRLAACKILGIPVSVLSLWDHRQMLPHPALLHSGGLNSGPHTCMGSFTHWTW